MLEPADKPADELNASEHDQDSSYPFPKTYPLLSASRFVLHMLWEDAKAKEERWQLAYERPAQKAGEGKGAVGVECGFQQAILHDIDEGLDDSCGPFAPTLNTGEIGNGHLPCLKWCAEDIGRGYSVHDGIVNAIATCR